jgi:chemotaxis family two-component system response regulator PixG
MNMFSDVTGCAKLAQKLARLSEQKGTGKLLLMENQSNKSESSEPAGEPIETRQWELQFLQGQLLYAIGYHHRVRRWSRSLQQNAPNFVIQPMTLPVKEPWEYQILTQGLINQKLNTNQIKSMMRTTAQEVFFDLARYPSVQAKWQPSLDLDDREIRKINLNWLLEAHEVQQLIARGVKLWQKWQEMGLTSICPDRAPILTNPQNLKKQVGSESFLSLNTLFDGNHTIWDLAVKRKQSVLGLTRTLDYFIKTDKITLTKPADFAPPLEQLFLVTTAIANKQVKKPLIACIDDSPMIAERLEQILQPAGFRVLKINDPMQGVATLAEKKPDLIFLDVVMPHTNGYNVCSFLRHSSLFRNTPIIILTSQNGFIDRTKAKLNGASDFLSKPPEQTQVLAIVKKYFQENSEDNLSEKYPTMPYNIADQSVLKTS